jgi:hypothetical protein
MVQCYSIIVTFKRATHRVRLRRSAPVSIPLLSRMQPVIKYTYFFSPITAKAQKLLNCMGTGWRTGTTIFDNNNRKCKRHGSSA